MLPAVTDCVCTDFPANHNQPLHFISLLMEATDWFLPWSPFSAFVFCSGVKGLYKNNHSTLSVGFFMSVTVCASRLANKGVQNAVSAGTVCPSSEHFTHWTYGYRCFIIYNRVRGSCSAFGNFFCSLLIKTCSAFGSDLRLGLTAPPPQLSASERTTYEVNKGWAKLPWKKGNVSVHY